MIALPCRVARLFFTLLRRTSVARPRDAPPLVSLRQGREGLTLTAWRGEVGLSGICSAMLVLVGWVLRPLYPVLPLLASARAADRPDEVG